MDTADLVWHHTLQESLLILCYLTCMPRWWKLLLKTWRGAQDSVGNVGLSHQRLKAIVFWVKSYYVHRNRKGKLLCAENSRQVTKWRHCIVCIPLNFNAVGEKNNLKGRQTLSKKPHKRLTSFCGFFCLHERFCPFVAAAERWGEVSSLLWMQQLGLMCWRWPPVDRNWRIIPAFKPCLQNTRNARKKSICRLKTCQEDLKSP